jgi:multimeric flavodoxin WrbA
MKVLAINGSPRKEGKNRKLLLHALSAPEAEEIETELLQIGSTEIRGCLSCDQGIE